MNRTGLILYLTSAHVAPNHRRRDRCRPFRPGTHHPAAGRHRPDASPGPADQGGHRQRAALQPPIHSGVACHPRQLRDHQSDGRSGPHFRRHSVLPRPRADADSHCSQSRDSQGSRLQPESGFHPQRGRRRVQLLPDLGTTIHHFDVQRIVCLLAQHQQPHHDHRPSERDPFLQSDPLRYLPMAPNSPSW